MKQTAFWGRLLYRLIYKCRRLLPVYGLFPYVVHLFCFYLFFFLAFFVFIVTIIVILFHLLQHIIIIIIVIIITASSAGVVTLKMVNQNLEISFDPFSSGDPLKGNWQTVQTQIRCRRWRRLIRVSTVCKYFSHFLSEYLNYRV